MYSYNIYLNSNILQLEFFEDRFPHLIGIDKIINKKARKIIYDIKNKPEIFLLKNIKNNSNFINVKYKLLHFFMLEDIFKNFNFYKIYKIQGKIKAEFIMLKFDNGIEINLCLDYDDTTKKYIPRSFLSSSKSKDYGKFIKNSKEEKVLKVERLNKKTHEIDIIFESEQLEVAVTTQVDIEKE